METSITPLSLRYSKVSTAGRRTAAVAAFLRTWAALKLGPVAPYRPNPVAPAVTFPSAQVSSSSHFDEFAGFLVCPDHVMTTVPALPKSTVLVRTRDQVYHTRARYGCTHARQIIGTLGGSWLGSVRLPSVSAPL